MWCMCVIVYVCHCVQPSSKDDEEGCGDEDEDGIDMEYFLETVLYRVLYCVLYCTYGLKMCCTVLYCTVNSNLNLMKIN